MRHCDDDVLAALALGEEVAGPDSTHVASCERCLQEVEALRHTVSLIPLGAGVALMEPPTRVWDAIRTELEAPAQAESPFHAPSPSGGAERDDLAERRERRRGNPWVVGVAAAVAGLVVGGFGVTLVSNDAEPSPTLVAQAALADLATEESAGTARVEKRADGTEVLVVDTVYQPAVDGSLEVWLIDPDVVGMVSLGFLTGDHGEFEIPAGYDVGAFPIVDISVEPADGDPTHSGDSITRGLLEG